METGSARIGCHTYGLHVPGGVLGVSANELRDDLHRFQKTMQTELGKTTDILAWPYGIHDQRSTAIAKEAGFKYILTSEPGYLWTQSRFTAIPRLNIYGQTGLADFKKTVSAA